MKNTLPDPRSRATTTSDEFDFLPEAVADTRPGSDQFDLIYRDRPPTSQSLDWDLSADAMREAAASEFRKRVFTLSLLGVLLAAGLFAIPMLQRGNLSSIFDWSGSSPAPDASAPAATLPPAPPAIADTPSPAPAPAPAVDANAAVASRAGEPPPTDTTASPRDIQSAQAPTRVAPTPPAPDEAPKQTARVEPPKPKPTPPVAITKTPAPPAPTPRTPATIAKAPSPLAIPRVEAPKQPPLSQQALTARNDTVPPRAPESQSSPTTTTPPSSATPAQAVPTPPATPAALSPPTAAASAPPTTPSATDASRTGTQSAANRVSVPSDVNRVRLPSDVNRVTLPSQRGANDAALSTETAARAAAPASAPAPAPAATATPAPATAPTPTAPASAPSAPATSASTPAAAAPRSAAAVIDRSRDADIRSIEGALARYRNAFNALNARAAAEVWPNVDTRTLTRAFDQLKEQRIAFDGCQTDIKDTRASAVCTGVTRYVPRIGGRTQVDRRQWTFNLAKVRDEWMIQSVEAR